MISYLLLLKVVVVVCCGYCRGSYRFQHRIRLLACSTLLVLTTHFIFSLIVSTSTRLAVFSSWSVCPVHLDSTRLYSAWPGQLISSNNDKKSIIIWPVKTNFTCRKINIRAIVGLNCQLESEASRSRELKGKEIYGGMSLLRPSVRPFVRSLASSFFYTIARKK